MIKTYFKGLNDPKQRVAATRLDIATNGIEDVERRARNCSKLEHKVGELEAENRNFKDENKELRELKNDFDKLRRSVKVKSPSALVGFDFNLYKILTLILRCETFSKFQTHRHRAFLAL